MPHSTNYYNTLIEIAVDCPVAHGEMPPIKEDKRTVAVFGAETDQYRDLVEDEAVRKIKALKSKR